MLKASVYSSSLICFRSFLCFSCRSSLRRLSSNFFVGKIGARGRGRNSSLSIVILSFFFFGIWVYRICRVERRRKRERRKRPVLFAASRHGGRRGSGHHRPRVGRAK